MPVCRIVSRAASNVIVPASCSASTPPNSITLASWRRQFLSVRFVPKRANFNNGSLALSAAVWPEMRSANCRRVTPSTRKVAAALFLKKVTVTVRVSISLAALDDPFVSSRMTRSRCGDRLAGHCCDWKNNLYE